MPAPPRPETERGEAAYRQVLGHFCTGVTVVTGIDGDGGRPAGLACQASAALSLMVGRVTQLGPCQPDRPLLFHRGRYAAMEAGSGTGPAEVVDTLLAWPRHADWL